MAYEPVARRTRLRKAEVSKRFREMNKKARIAAKTECMKKKKSYFQSRVHNLEDVGEEEEDDDDEEVFEVIDKEEFERGRKNLRNRDFGFDDLHDDVNHDYDDHEWVKKLEEKIVDDDVNHEYDYHDVGKNSEEKIMDDDVNHEHDDHDVGKNLDENIMDCEGDSSDVEFLGGGFNIDDVDDDDDDDDVDVPSCSYKSEKKEEENPANGEDSEFSSSGDDDDDDYDDEYDDEWLRLKKEEKCMSKSKTGKKKKESKSDFRDFEGLIIPSSDDDYDDDEGLRLKKEEKCMSKSKTVKKEKESNSDFRDFEGLIFSSSDDDDEGQRLKGEKEEKKESATKNKRGRKKKNPDSDVRVFEGLPILSNSTPQLTPIVNRTRSNLKKPKSLKKVERFSTPVNVVCSSSEDEEEEGNLRVDPNPNPNPNLNPGEDNNGKVEESIEANLPVDPNPTRKPRQDNNGRVEESVISEEEANHPVDPTPTRNPREDDNGENKKRKRDKGFKATEMHKIIFNSLGENGGDQDLEKLMSRVSELILPTNFKFGFEEVVVKEKTEEEIEEELLWKEMDFALGACNIGMDYNCGDHDSRDFIPSDNVIEQAKLCKKGMHYLYLDDEIGIVCKFCSYVHTESKYLYPDFNENPFRKHDSRNYGRVLDSNGIPSVDYERLQNNASDSIACGTRDTYGTVWDLIPGTKEVLYPHQREGFEFIWKNVAGGTQISDLGNSISGLGGCIICHAPGTGKTRLAIVFLQSYLKQYPKSRPMIIAPASVLLTWEDEFVRWKTGIPFLNMNNSDFSGEENQMLQNLVGSKKDMDTVRYVKLFTWVHGKGVLGISYPLFEKMTSVEDDKKRDSHTLKTKKIIRDSLLTKSGILVLDEGHTPRNENSQIWKALSNVTTRKKIILSGTPFQNNFQELYTTITLAREEFVDPLLADSYRKSRDNGKRSSSMLTGEDLNRRIEELKLGIKPFVHVYKGEILKEKLPGLLISVLVLKPSELQKECFNHLRKFTNSFEFDNLVSMTSVHPSNLLSRGKFPDFLDKKMEHSLKEHESDLDAGVKSRFLFELIKLCRGEKVLVFSQYLDPLKFLGGLLEKILKWTEGEQFLYMDGKQDTKVRQNSIRVFNDPRSEARVLLASTKACCEGIQLVGASRVVLLDVVWNPSVERQAISRAYRLGQTKNVHVYHLLTTLELNKYYRKENKDRVSQLVFAPTESESLKTNNACSGLEDRILNELVRHEKTKHIFERIINQPKADDLIENFG